MAVATAPLPAPLPIDPAYRPAAAIQSLPATAALEEVLNVLDRDGGLILEDFATRAELEAIQQEIAENKGDIGEENTAISLIPKETVLVPGLVGKSKTMASFCESRVLTELRKYILTEEFTVDREGYTDHRSIDPLLSMSISFNIGPGAPRQRLHRDDNVHGTKHSQPFDLKKASQFACLIAGCDTRRENGATMFVPGSHRWDDNRRPRVDEICFAEMKAGSALIFLGAAYHGGGHNSLPDFRRIVHALFFIRGNLRQEENQFLAVPRSKVLNMNETMLALLGYKQPASVLGIVDNKDPASDLKSVLDKANS